MSQNRWAGLYPHLEPRDASAAERTDSSRAEDGGEIGQLEHRGLWNRALDLLVAVVALVALAPLFVLIALAVKLDSRGPVFVSTWRLGPNGRASRTLRFRSERSGAEARIAALSSREEVLAPRVTRVGKLLRHFSLDELPQLWCVLSGETSLFGPRRLAPHEVDGHLTWPPSASRRSGQLVSLADALRARQRPEAMGTSRPTR
ncbi:MAG TPA: sugar transferase [Planctomycetota bacterium]